MASREISSFRFQMNEIVESIFHGTYVTYILEQYVQVTVIKLVTNLPGTKFSGTSLAIWYSSA